MYGFSVVAHSPGAENVWRAENHIDVHPFAAAALAFVVVDGAAVVFKHLLGIFANLGTISSAGNTAVTAPHR
jgi:hypothetical protein